MAADDRGCTQAQIDAGCCHCGQAPVPPEIAAPFPVINAMTACRAAPLIQKRIA